MRIARGAMHRDGICMGFWQTFRRKSDGLPPWAALDQEALRISAAMEHVQEHGNLDAFPGSQNEKLALMLTASRQGLVTWNREQQRYELTGLGRERLGLRRTLQDAGAPASAPVRPAPAPAPAATAAAPAGRAFALGSGTIAAGIAGVAIGAAAVALLPGSSKSPPHEQAAVATASKPADAQSAGSQAQDQKPAPPPHEQASVARNPGIPCVAGKCLETGGSGEQAAAQIDKQQAPQPEKQQAAQAEKQQQAVNAAPVAAPPPASPNPAPAKPASQARVHPGAAGATEGAIAQQLALAAESAPPPPATTADQPSPETAASEGKPPTPPSKPPSRTADRTPAHQAAPPASNPEPPGFAQQSTEPGRAASKSSRSRHTATEQRRSSRAAEERQGWREGKGKFARDREQVEEGDPGDG